jgi:hypothetical protein
MIPVTQPNGQGNVLSPGTNTQGGIGGPSASPPGGTPKRQQAPRNSNTFAGMQQTGMARPSRMMANSNAQMPQQPAPQAAAPAAGASPYQPTTQSAMQAGQQVVNNAQAGYNNQPFQQSAAVGALGAPLMQQVMALLQDPTQGLNEAAQSNFDRNNRVIGREFDTMREGLNENLAARGLDASTIAVSGLGQLGERQAEAQGDLAARVQEKLINDRAAAMQAAINSAMGLRGQEAELGAQEYTINRDTGELEFRRGLDSNKFALDAELGRGNLAINQGNLDLSRDRFGFDQFRDSRNFDYGVDRDAVGDEQFDRRFDFDVSRDTRDFDYRVGRDEVGDSQFDRTFDYNEGRDNRDFDYRTGRDQVGDERWQTTFDRDNDWRNEDTGYRDRRDEVTDDRWQTTFDADQERFDRNFDQNDRNFNTSTAMDLIRSMGLEGIDPKQMENIFKMLGIQNPIDPRPEQPLPFGTRRASGSGTSGGSSGSGDDTL